MRILIITNKIPYPPTDGGAIATLNIALGLADAGAWVTVLAMSTPKHNSRAIDFPPNIRKKMEIKDVFVDTSIHLGKALKNLLYSNLPYNAERFVSKAFERELERILQDKYDVVQLEGPYILPYLDTIKRMHKGLVALRAHNVEWEIWARNASLKANPFTKLYFKILSKRLRKFEINLLERIDVLVPITQLDELKFKQMGFNKKSFVCQAGFRETSSLNTFPQMEFPSVFHIGGLDWLPNREGIIWFLKYCWPSITRKMPGLKFYIAGRNAPQSFINKLSGCQNVVFCGEVDDSATFMLSKALMVVPLLSGSGMRVKIVEGLARGRAIVTTSVGVEGLDVQNGVEVYIADNPTEFSRRVVELLENESAFNQMVIDGRGYVNNKLNNSILTKNLFGFYKSLVFNKSPNKSFKPSKQELF